MAFNMLFQRYFSDALSFIDLLRLSECPILFTDGELIVLLAVLTVTFPVKYGYGKMLRTQRFLLVLEVK